MRRIALLSSAVLGLALGIAACGNSPVQPGEQAAALESTPTLAKSRPAPACESLVYPPSLCVPANRPALCAALRGPDAVEFQVIVGSRTGTATFTRASAFGGSQEVVTIPRGFRLPPIVLRFNVTDAQIGTICPTPI